MLTSLKYNGVLFQSYRTTDASLTKIHLVTQQINNSKKKYMVHCTSPVLISGHTKSPAGFFLRPDVGKNKHRNHCLGP